MSYAIPPGPNADEAKRIADAAIARARITSAAELRRRAALLDKKAYNPNPPNRKLPPA